jgi:ribosomal protein L23
VEEIFKVKVLAVNTCRYEGKKKRLGETKVNGLIGRKR